MPNADVPMVPPPLNTKDDEENRSANDLCDNSTEKSSAHQSGNNCDSCGDESLGAGAEQLLDEAFRREYGKLP